MPIGLRLLFRLNKWKTLPIKHSAKIKLCRNKNLEAFPAFLSLCFLTPTSKGNNCVQSGMPSALCVKRFQGNQQHEPQIYNHEIFNCQSFQNLKWVGVQLTHKILADWSTNLLCHNLFITTGYILLNHSCHSSMEYMKFTVPLNNTNLHHCNHFRWHNSLTGPNAALPAPPLNEQYLELSV